ncbi:MAG: bacterial Ig-like domain-containing protein [Clostridia bacterium]|nr:bacterial Ig-like domain-containing protein [Clostridia bacterium]
MITLNKEILMHPDFTKNLEKELCELLEALMDAEFEKGDETDFDFIDECADAVNAIRSGFSAQALPLISRRDFIAKVSGSSSGNVIKIAAAICAVIAIAFSVNTVLNAENTDIISEVSGFFSGLFTNRIDPIEATDPPPVTREPSTKAASVNGITVETDEDFRTEYYIGESFSCEGIKVFAEYDNGERRLLSANEYEVITSKSFGAEAKTESVTVKYKSFEKALEVRILVSETTPVLNSVYAVFPENFEFTANDLENISLSQMQVYAVYSDGNETELSADEYTVETEIENGLFEQSALVTVSYNGCSCSFMVYKE